MRQPAWHVEDPETSLAPIGGAASGLVSLHFVRSALLRRWRWWVAAGLIGMLLAVGHALLVPPERTGTVTLLLAHDAGSDPAVAVATDVGLLRTRAVAESVIDAVGLDTTPEDLQRDITVTPTTPSIVVLDIAAPDASKAQEWVEALATSYLDFRAEQLRSQADAAISGQESRVKNLQAQVDRLTSRYEQVVAAGGAAQNEASALLTQRAQLANQISSLQQDIDQRALDVSSVITASHVVDTPSVVPVSSVRRLVLAAGTGLIGGMALGVGLVLVMALTSQRLRQRDEVSRALGVPVRFSVRSPSRLPWRRAASRRQRVELADAMLTVLFPAPSPAGRLALVSLGDPDATARLADALGDRVAAAGSEVCLVDRTHQQLLASDAGDDAPAGRTVVAAEPGTGAPPLVSLVPEAASRAPTPRRPWDAADVVIVVDQIDLGLGVEHLRTWAPDQAVLVLDAGAASAEMLGTVGRLFRVARIDLSFAVLVRADATDESSGLPEPASSTPPEHRLRL